MGRNKLLQPLDDNESFEYPSSLVGPADSGAWTSPTKAVKRYHQTLKRRPPSGKKASKQVKVNSEPEDQFVDGSSQAADVGFDLSSLDPGPSETLYMFPELTPTVPKAELQLFMEGVETFGVLFRYLGQDADMGGNIFVVQGWDNARLGPTVCPTLFCGC